MVRRASRSLRCAITWRVFSNLTGWKREGAVSTGSQRRTWRGGTRSQWTAVRLHSGWIWARWVGCWRLNWPAHRNSLHLEGSLRVTANVEVWWPIIRQIWDIERGCPWKLRSSWTAERTGRRSKDYCLRRDEAVLCFANNLRILDGRQSEDRFQSKDLAR